MRKLIIRGDDLGYSEAVNYGIAKAVKDGLVGSVGIMPNMPAVTHGLKLLADTDVCLGLHVNICLGTPCAPQERIPSLLDPEGRLKSSREYREAYKQGESFTRLDEMIMEIEAQHRRFAELTGKQLGYFEAHAVVSDHLYQGLEMVAAKYGLRYSNVSPMDETGLFAGKPITHCPMESMKDDYDPWQSLKRAVNSMREDMPNVFVCHPGYLDWFLLNNSSLTINRTKETEMLCDPAVRTWLEEQKVELCRYCDIL